MAKANDSKTEEETMDAIEHAALVALARELGPVLDALGPREAGALRAEVRRTLAGERDR